MTEQKGRKFVDYWPTPEKVSEGVSSVSYKPAEAKQALRIREIPSIEDLVKIEESYLTFETDERDEWNRTASRNFDEDHQGGNEEIQHYFQEEIIGRLLDEENGKSVEDAVYSGIWGKPDAGFSANDRIVFLALDRDTIHVDTFDSDSVWEKHSAGAGSVYSKLRNLRDAGDMPAGVNTTHYRGLKAFGADTNEGDIALKNFAVKTLEELDYDRFYIQFNSNSRDGFYQILDELDNRYSD